MHAIQLENISKDYFAHKRKISVLKKIDLQISNGETIALLGHSGSGKSTILTLCAGLDTPSEGNISVGNLSYSKLSQQQRREQVPKQVSIIFQKFHLMPHLNAIENILLPLEIQTGTSNKELAMNLLHEVGLQDRLEHYPSQLSGGEQQRVAIARALINKPTILLADEPTGNLDDTTAKEVSKLLFDIVRSQGMSMLLVTHDKDLAKLCNKRFELKDGHLHELNS